MNKNNTEPRLVRNIADITSPSLRALYLDWDAKRGDNHLPPIGAVDLLDHVEHAPHWMILDVVNDGTEYIFRYAGSELVERIDIEPTGLKRGTAKFPHTDSIDLLDYAEAASRWSILDVVNGGEYFDVRMCGTQIVNMIGMDLTGQRISGDLSELPGIAIQNRMGTMFRTVIDTSKPIVFGPKTSSVKDKEFLTFNSICLPFSDDGETVTSIIHALAIVPTE